MTWDTSSNCAQGAALVRHCKTYNRYSEYKIRSHPPRLLPTSGAVSYSSFTAANLYSLANKRESLSRFTFGIYAPRGTQLVGSAAARLLRAAVKSIEEPINQLKFTEAPRVVPAVFSAAAAAACVRTHERTSHRGQRHRAYERNGTAQPAIRSSFEVPLGLLSYCTLCDVGRGPERPCPDGTVNALLRSLALLPCRAKWS